LHQYVTGCNSTLIAIGVNATKSSFYRGNTWLSFPVQLRAEDALSSVLPIAGNRGWEFRLSAEVPDIPSSQLIGGIRQPGSDRREA
jgi:hypothetical protein